MKYSLMSHMVDAMLKHEKTNFILSSILGGMGIVEIPEDAEAAYHLLNEHGVPMTNGSASFEDMVVFTKEHGFDGLDLMSYQMELPAKEVKSIMEKHDVVLSAFNIIVPFSEADSEEVFQGMLAYGKSEIDKGIEAGAREILFVPAGYNLNKGMTREQCYQNCVRALREIVAYGQEKGIMISTETLESSAVPMSSFGEMKRLFEDVPGLYYNHDTGNPLVSKEDPLNHYLQFKDKVINVHFKNMCTAVNSMQNYQCVDGSTLSLAPLNDGLVDYEAHIKALLDNNYQGYITIEGGIPADNKWEEAIAALQYFRDMESHIE